MNMSGKGNHACRSKPKKAVHNTSESELDQI